MTEFNVSKKTRSFVIRALTIGDLETQLEDFFKTHIGVKVINMMQTLGTFTPATDIFRTELFLTIIFEETTYTRLDDK